jgi:hypothetical protein
METAVEYRSLAETLRQEAMAATLVHVRETRLAAAERWERLAAEIEMVTAPGRMQPRPSWIF